ncbi:MAG: T9SS type A sorting domain-containing protein [candidate division Zixibacteria bacterium]|nr:T9SS type A sorting domain-containing protein [candidate division Zixibacteria bacterium]
MTATAYAGGIDRLPDQTLLWNRFHTVTIVDSFALALSPEGIVVSRYDLGNANFVQVQQLFLDDEPVQMKVRDGLLLVHTMRDSLLIVDISHLPSLSRLGAVDVGIPLSDFDIHEQDLYVSAWFSGILRYSIDEHYDIRFADSSMKPVLVTQLEISGDTLYGLDEYNGVIRYDLAGAGFGRFVDYLFVPQRAALFGRAGEEFIIAAINDGILFGRFGQTGSGIVESVDGGVPVVKVLMTESQFVLVGDRVVQLMDRADHSQRTTFEIDDDRPDGDLFYLDDLPYLILPGRTGGLVMYSLADPGQSRIAYDRPGPVRGMSLHADRLYTGGQSNPIDVFSLDRWRRTPRLDFTVYPGLQNVAALDHNGDSLIVLYHGLNRIAFITSSSDPDEYYLEGSVSVDANDAVDLEYLPNWLNDGAAVMVRGAFSISIYPINDSTGILHAATWPFLGEVLSVATADSVLYVSTGKNAISIYRVNDDLSLMWLSQIDLAIPAFQLHVRDSRLTYFTYDDMTYVDCSDPVFPVVEEVTPLTLPVTDGVLYDNRLYTVGVDGVAIYDLATSPPGLVAHGGRAGEFLATDGRVVATSGGGSIHLYYLHRDRIHQVHVEPPVPDRFGLSQNYPNPFNPITFIDFTLPQPEQVRVEVFNLLGQTVRTLLDAQRGAGLHTVAWDAQNDQGQPVASGVYIYRINAGDQRASRKMLLMR